VIKAPQVVRDFVECVAVIDVLRVPLVI